MDARDGREGAVGVLGLCACWLVSGGFLDLFFSLFGLVGLFFGGPGFGLGWEAVLDWGLVRVPSREGMQSERRSGPWPSARDPGPLARDPGYLTEYGNDLKSPIHS